MKVSQFFFLLFFLPISLLAQYSCFIQGKMKGIETGKVSVYEHVTGNRILLAGQTEVVNGTFSLTIKCTSSPVISFHIAQSNSSKLFFLTKEDTLTLEGEIGKSENWRLSHLEEQADFEEYEKLNAKLTEIRRLYAEQLKNLPFPQMQQAKETYQLAFLHNKEHFLQEMANFIQAKAQKLVALYALHQHFLYEREVTQLERLYLQLPPRKNVLTSQIESAIEYGQATKYGAKLDNFQLTSDTGKTIQLADFQGKYLLIEFWASWCRPCRETIPLLHNLYQHPQGLIPFEVLAISTDKDTSAWREALQNDATSWINVIDHPDFQQAIAKKYKVGLIPANFLLNEKGEIIGKNLSMGELKEMLQKK